MALPLVKKNWTSQRCSEKHDSWVFGRVTWPDPWRPHAYWVYSDAGWCAKPAIEPGSTKECKLKQLYEVGKSEGMFPQA